MEFSSQKGVIDNEEDISAQKTAPQERARLSQADENQKRQKSACREKAQRQGQTDTLEGQCTMRNASIDNLGSAQRGRHCQLSIVHCQL